jgi:hypothetical protein
MAKNIGYGSSLAVTTTTGSLAIGQIKTMSFGGSDATDVDTTTLDSSTNYRTFRPAPIDPGDLSMTVVYDPQAAAHRRLITYFEAFSTKTFTVTYNTTTSDTQAFSAYIKTVGAEIPLDDLVTADITLKITGDAAWQST